MSELGLFLVGLGVTIPAAIAIIALMLAAVADGRDDDEFREQHQAEPVRDREATPTP